MTDRIRTVQIQLAAPADAPGGGPRHARNLARGFAELGIRTTVLCTGVAAASGPACYAAWHVCRVRPRRLLWRLGQVGALGDWCGAVRRCTSDVDAVVALSPAPALATAWTRPRLPLVYAPAVLDRVEHPHRWPTLYQWLECRALHAADAVLVRSTAVREVVVRLYGRQRGPFGIALPGIDPCHALGAVRTRAQLGVPVGAKLLITVGLVNENKGQHLIAQALARHAGPDWWWAIIGEGPGGRAIRAALRDGGMADRTLFVGVDRVADWYAAADVLVAASRHETFGQAIAEALCAGLPVVVPKNEPGAVLSPLAEHVEDFALGGTYRRGDREGMGQALWAVLGNSAVRARLGENAAGFAGANFTWARYAECALRLLTTRSDAVYPIESAGALRSHTRTSVLTRGGRVPCSTTP